MSEIFDTREVRIVKLMCAEEMFSEWMTSEIDLVKCPFGVWIKREIEKARKEKV